jgi:uncharacterized protein YdaU (DUF1376 family)
MNYYERYCGDYQRDTAHLTLCEHGAFTMLLDAYYSTEKPLPSEHSSLYRICRAMSKVEQAAVRSVADEFFPIGEDGQRHNNRADAMIAKARPKMEAARSNGKKGGRPRKNNEPENNQRETQWVLETEPSDNPNTTQVESSTTPTPSTTSIVIATSSRELSDDFIPRNEAQWLRHMRSKHGFTADESSVHDRKRYWPTFSAWVNAGIRTDQVDAAIAKAHAESSEPISNIVAYAARVLDGMTAPKKPKSDQWFVSPQAMSAKARELGIADARPGESEAQFKARIQYALSQKEVA